MKLFFSALLSLSSLVLNAQQETFDFYYSQGQAEFYKPNGTSNLILACKYLEKAAEIDSTHQELNYFLAHAYDRINAEDGNGIPLLNDETSMKASNALERCIAIAPIYAGKKVVQDPYSKLNSVWGSLGLKYLYQGKLDTLSLVLAEGKKRGAFMEPLLEYHRTALNQLPENTVLLSSGDNMTYPLLYLQAVESMRPDISVVDVNLLNSDWYPIVIKNLYPELLSIPSEKIIDIKSKGWKNIEYTFRFFEEPEPDLPKEREFNSRPQKRNEDEEDYDYYLEELEEEKLYYEEEIQDAYDDMDDPELLDEFSWELKPSMYVDSAGFILRGDLILIKILGNCVFNRPVYHTKEFPSNKILSLNDYFFPEGLCTAFIMNPDERKEIKSNVNQSFSNMMSVKIKSLQDPHVQHSEDLVSFLNFYRIGFIEAMEAQKLEENLKKVERLRAKMIEVIPKEIVPYYPEDLKNRLSF